MSESVLAILKLCFLAVLYLFVARVVRAVWVEISAVPQPGRGGQRTNTTERHDPANETSAGRALVRGRRGGDTAADQSDGRRGRQGRRKQADRLVVVEPPDQRGTAFPLADEMTLGRGAGCAVPLQDTFASGLHARIFRREGVFYVEDLGSTNGTWLNRKRVHGPVPVHSGDRVQVGNTVLEMRA